MKHITLVREYQSVCLFLTANSSRCYAKDSMEYFIPEKIVIVIETLDLSLCHGVRKILLLHRLFDKSVSITLYNILSL